MNTQRPEDGFEDRLLHELKSVVADNPVPAVAKSRFTTKRALSVGGVAVAGIAAIAAPVLLAGSPAYAVEPTADGVKVEVNDVVDPQELEDALAEAEVPAEIEYLEPGMTCADGWYQDARDSAIAQYGTQEAQNADDPMLTFDIEFTDFNPKTDTLILTMTQESEEKLSMGGVGHISTVTSGEIGECVPEEVEEPEDDESTEEAKPQEEHDSSD